MLFFHNKIKKGAQRVFSIKPKCSPPGMVIINRKRASFAASSLQLKAGMTLEAAIVLPLFIAALIAVIFFIRVITVQNSLQKALVNQTMKISGYSYYLNIKGEESKAKNLIKSAYIKSQVIKELGREYLDNSVIKKGSSGISFGLEPVNEKGILDVQLIYSAEVPCNVFGIKPIRLISRARCRTWLGMSDEQRDKMRKNVYVAKNGTVYHTNIDCTFIKKDISNCAFSEISGIRNTSGGKYYACELCAKKGTADKVYYTKYGSRYHFNKTCGNLHTNVYYISLEDAQKKYRQCSKCKETTK